MSELLRKRYDADVDLRSLNEMKTMIFTSGYTHMVLNGRIEIVINEFHPNLINIYHGPGCSYVALKDAGTLTVRTL